jgi:hypothetical protein
VDEPVYGKWSFVATRPGFILLLVAFALCEAGFEVRKRYLGPAPDARWPSYTDRELHDRLADFGAAGRRAYAVTELTLDALFPPVYAGLFAALIAYCYPKEVARRLVFVPLLAMTADLCENVCLAYLAWTYQDGHVAVTCWAAACTAAKFVLFALSLALVAAGAVITLVRYLWRRRQGAAAGPGGADT